ncbi:MAG TPA: 16S rRNA (adenine(1518)-N(6)/adenine(1519)-N(6))-dimethyltransferase RsmA [Steroidobacteraceae bacterium]|nr:16S rRNA (adenine(1518)-N(6)/adenine(1519)-N(6))-dimethyltransferase RsmA [Steroidobacteraceae bacterium]
MRPRHAKKRYGQHFLHDPGTIERIVRAIDPRAEERIVEVGPGRGAITAPVLERAGAIDVVEIDGDVIPALQARCAGRGELRVHVGDALEFDFRALRGAGPKLRLIGNLPYNVSTPLLFRFIEQIDAIADMHFMLQREVVSRMAARPDTDDYGRLTVTLAPHVAVEPLFDIGTGAFSPPPQVVSTFFRLHPHARPPFDTGDPAAFARVVSAAFSKRRKTLRNALGGVLTAEQIRAAGIDPGARAETLSPAQFGALARELRPAAGERDTAAG